MIFIKSDYPNHSMLILVIDTGDISDYGTPLEADLITKLNDIDIPYIISPGNHDSPTIIERLQELENVTVLINDVVEKKRSGCCWNI